MWYEKEILDKRLGWFDILQYRKYKLTHLLFSYVNADPQ